MRSSSARAAAALVGFLPIGSGLGRACAVAVQALLDVRHDERTINPHQFLLLLHSLGVKLPASEVGPLGTRCIAMRSASRVQ